MAMKNANHRITLDSILEEEGILKEVRAIVTKERLAWQIAQAMKMKRLTKVKLAAAMKTSRAQLDRVLDPKSGNVTLATLQKAANAVGMTLRAELV